MKWCMLATRVSKIVFNWLAFVKASWTKVKWPKTDS